MRRSRSRHPPARDYSFKRRALPLPLNRPILPSFLSSSFPIPILPLWNWISKYLTAHFTEQRRDRDTIITRSPVDHHSAEYLTINRIRRIKCGDDRESRARICILQRLEDNNCRYIPVDDRNWPASRGKGCSPVSPSRDFHLRTATSSLPPDQPSNFFFLWRSTTEDVIRIDWIYFI